MRFGKVYKISVSFLWFGKVGKVCSVLVRFVSGRKGFVKVWQGSVLFW